MDVGSGIETNGTDTDLEEKPRPDELQVGGHLTSEGKKGHLTTRLKVFKPFQGSGRGTAEFDFYAKIFEESASQILCELRPFVPKFFGSVKMSDQDGLSEYLVLENLVGSLSKPSIVDVKMGTRTWDDVCSLATAQRKKKKEANSTTPTLGFRITGMRVYQPTTNHYITYDRRWGSSRTAADISKALHLFFDDGTKEGRFRVIPRILELLESILKWFEKQTSYRFYAASLLLIYDGDQKPDGDESVSLRLIDFAHVCPASPPSPDEGFLIGLRNLISTLLLLSQDYSSSLSSSNPSAVSNSVAV